MLAELTPYVVQGIDLARRDTYWNYHLRSMMDAMGFKDIEKRMPPDPGQAVADAGERMALGQPLAETIRHSSNRVRWPRRTRRSWSRGSFTRGRFVSPTSRSTS